jgi:hypothetical protein
VHLTPDERPRTRTGPRDPRCRGGWGPVAQPAEHLVTLGSVPRPAAQEVDAERVEVARDTVRHGARGGRIGLLLRRQHGERFAVEREVPGQRLEEDHPDAVPVARRCEDLACRLLGRHVRGGPYDLKARVFGIVLAL